MEITIKGVLVGNISHIGGETTGWVIRLDEEIEFEGTRLTEVEVNRDTGHFRALENKHVEATGELRLWPGVERLFWPVLEVERIREVQRGHKLWKYARRVSVIVGIIAGVIAITGSSYGVATWLYGRASKNPLVVVREQLAEAVTGEYLFKLKFSIINRADSFLYVNGMHFVEGSLKERTAFSPFEWLPIMMIIVPEYHDALSIKSVEASQTGKVVSGQPQLDGRFWNWLKSWLVEGLPGRRHQIFKGPPARLDPRERVDYHLQVRVAKVKGIDLSRLRNPYMEGWIVIEYERTDGKPREATGSADLAFLGGKP